MACGVGDGYGGAMGGDRVPGAHHGQPGGLAVGERVAGLAMGLGTGVGYGGVLGGAGALGAPYRQPSGFVVGPGKGFDHGGALGGAGVITAPSVTLGPVACDGLGALGVDRTLLGDGGACDPSTTLGKQINIVTARTVTS